MSIPKSTVLTYHSLDSTGSVISTHPDLFRRQMEFLRERQIPVVPLADVGRVAGAVALTFDDGFRNFLEVAAPVLAECGFPATVFVVSGYCGRSNDWPSQPRGVPLLELMGWSDLETLAQAGIELGAHTVSHPDLASLPLAEAEREMQDSRTELEDRCSRPVRAFAYPYGSSTAALRKIAASHFETAFGTALAYTEPAADPFDLPRVDVFYLRRPSLFQQVVSGKRAGYLHLRSLLRTIRRIL